jgi:uncharacterized protein
METERTYTAFAGNRLIVSGNLRTTVLRTKECLDRGEGDPVLIFEDQTGTQIDFDLRGSPDEVLVKLASHPLFASSEAQAQLRIGPGRPRLGVVCREISLLPRHWTWLDEQPGGVSVALRKLVEEARKRGQGKELGRAAREAAGKFMWVMAGNLPNFEEASRALFAKNQTGLKKLVRSWPEDIRAHLERLVAESVRLENETTAAAPPVPAFPA